MALSVLHAEVSGMIIIRAPDKKWLLPDSTTAPKDASRKGQVRSLQSPEAGPSQGPSQASLPTPAVDEERTDDDETPVQGGRSAKASKQQQQPYSSAKYLEELPKLKHGIPDVRDVFDPERIHENHPGYEPFPVLFGHLMPLGQFISGTGEWYHPYEALMRQSMADRPQANAVREMRLALERLFEAAGAAKDLDDDMHMSYAFDPSVPSERVRPDLQR